MSSGYIRDAAPFFGVSDKMLKRILTVVAFVLGTELVWIFGIRPCMPISRFEINGIPNLDREIILAAAGINEHSSFMTIRRESAEAALSLLPMVKSARLVKHFPSGIEIVLEPREAAALAITESGGRLKPVLIDGNGVILNIGKEGVRAPGEEDSEGYGGGDLPVISGISLDKAFPGMKLSRMYGGLFRQLKTIAAESPQLLQAFSEIRVNVKNYDGFDLTLFPAHIPIRVRAGPELNVETLKYMLLTLDVLSTRAGEIEEIDFRTGTASYMFKEAHSG